MKSIARRLLFGLTLIIGLSSALVVAMLALYETRVSKAALVADAETAARAFASMIEPAVWDVDSGRISGIAKAFARDPRIAQVTVVDESSGSAQSFAHIRTSDTLTRMAPVMRGGERLGRVTVAFDRSYYRNQILRQIASAAGVTLIALVMTLASLRILFRRLFRQPLEELSGIVRAYASGPRGHAMPYVEFAELGQVLDSMSIQIRDQLSALSRANRELETLNRFLLVAATDLESGELVAEAARELSELFRSSSVRASVVNDQGARELVLDVARPDVAPADNTLDIPLLLHDREVGRLALTREREFGPAEVAIAHSVAAQVVGAMARALARGNERLLRAAIEQLPDSVIITDKDNRIVYVNPGFTAITGYAPEEAIGQTTGTLKRAGLDEPVVAEVMRDLAEGKTWVGRLRSRTKAGRVYYEDMVVTPVRNQRGDITNFVGIARDVTADIQRDEQLRHAQRMDAVGQLAGGIAHDFNNMLGAALMQLDLLELDGALNPEVVSAISEIRGALDRAANLTRQLLMFSRRQAMRVRAHDLNMIVDDILRMLRRVIGEGIDVSFEPADATVLFEGDAGMIEQVIVNLCVNARDAMPAGGRLVIATSNATLDEDTTAPGHWACLEIRDTGTGMTPEIMQHIFEPFFTTKEVGRGTGLGLATTHGIVSQHGGWIDVKSEAGAGTTFSVYLPAALGDVVPEQAEPTRTARSGNATVLVVEDERVVREMVSRSLRQLGHTVIEAVTGRDALRIWADQGTNVDLVVTDMVMPDEMNGIELIQHLRRNTPHVRAIIMSGYSLQLAAESIPEDIAFLAKPFSLASLTKVIEDSLGAA